MDLTDLTKEEERAVKVLESMHLADLINVIVHLDEKMMERREAVQASGDQILLLLLRSPKKDRSNEIR